MSLQHTVLACTAAVRTVLLVHRDPIVPCVLRALQHSHWHNFVCMPYARIVHMQFLCAVTMTAETGTAQHAYNSKPLINTLAGSAHGSW